MSEIKYKIVIFGSGGVGKSAISVKFVQNKFCTDRDPSILEEYRKQEEVDGEAAILEIVDTAGQEEYKALRAQYYQKAEGFIAVYSITDRNSLAEVEKLRVDVLEERGAEPIPMVLVGNKCDMDSARRVSTKEGEAIAAAWSADGKGAVPFLESSAKDSTNIMELFHQVVRQVRQQRRGIPAPANPAAPAPAKAPAPDVAAKPPAADLATPSGPPAAGHVDPSANIPKPAKPQANTAKPTEAVKKPAKPTGKKGGKKGGKKVKKGGGRKCVVM